MTPRSLIPFLLLGVACSGPSTEAPAASATPPPTTVAAEPSPMGATFEAEVVTMDAAAPSVTLREGDVPATSSPKPKDLKAGDRTIRVEPSAAASLSGLKPGIRVRVTCSAAAAVITQGPGAAGTVSPATGASGTASASGAAMATTAPAGAGAMGSGPLTQCDSIVSLTALEAAAR